MVLTHRVRFQGRFASVLQALFWLPEAHVEAPTAGSVILAGLLLKLGTYGFLRFCLPLLPLASVFFTPLVYALSLLAIIYASLTTLRQSDLKKIVAYSSIAHMNVAMIGLYSLDMLGVLGSFVLMFSHGLVSPALFTCVGILYDRHKTRLCRYYSGCAISMPIFSLIFAIFTLANIALPLTVNFVGEFLVFVGTFANNLIASALCATSLVGSGCYALLAFGRAAFGLPKPGLFGSVCDLSRREFFILLPFGAGVKVLVGNDTLLTASAGQKPEVCFVWCRAEDVLT